MQQAPEAVAARTSLDRLCSSRLVLAPMVGLTHYVVRRAISEYLPPSIQALWPTEMLSSRRLPYQKEDQVPELIFKDKDSGLAPQLLGNEEGPIRESIRRLEDWGACVIDINMGCPVQKALRHNYGVALMGDPQYAAEVASMAVRSTSLPVSVKLRAGLQKDPEVLLNFCLGLERAGVSWITLHPRTAEEKRRGSADWNQIRLLKKELSIPVIGNGDIQTAGDVFKMIDETACDRVMAGRILTAKPWIFKQIHSAQNVEDWDSVTEAREYGRFLLRVLELTEESYSLEAGLKRFNFLIYHGHVWLEFGLHLYSQVRKAKSYAECRKALQVFFAQDRRMFERTELRR